MPGVVLRVEIDPLLEEVVWVWADFEGRSPTEAIVANGKGPLRFVR